MQCLTFITDTDGRSGKVSSRKTRTVIRAHVTRQHWAENPARRISIPLIKGSPGCGAVDPTCVSAVHENDAEPDDATLAPRRKSDGGAIMTRTTQTQQTHGLRPYRHLNRVTDDFVYAGSAIDQQSYSLFRHYSSECENFPIGHLHLRLALRDS